MSDSTRVTVVVENTAGGPAVLAEHGLAYWIEDQGRHALFDTGQGRVLIHNAGKLQTPLYAIDALVLSHGHYDHTGGVAEILKRAQAPMVYAQRAAFVQKFARNQNGTAREIGMPEAARKAIVDHHRHYVATDRPTMIFDRLTVTGPIPRRTDFEDTGGPFFLDESCTIPDPLEDDQAIFFDTAEGTVVLLGCAHSGIINTLHYVRELTDNRPIYGVIGGMHLVGASSDRIVRTVDELRKLNIRQLAPAHCTGMAATVALWNAFPSQCQTCGVGSRFEFA